MDLMSIQPNIANEREESEIKQLKRKIVDETCNETSKKLKHNEVPNIRNTEEIENGKQINKEENTQRLEDLNKNLYTTQNSSIDKETVTKVQLPNKVPISPKKRLEVAKPSSSSTSAAKGNKEKFIYGNYSQYYGYRNKDKDYHDIRLDVFAEQKEIFRNKQILDIGCNSGFITMEVAKQFEVKSIVGLDIDKSLINQAIKNLIKCKKSLPMDNELKRLQKFPFNITFVHGNYVLKNEVLLEIERPQFDVILCLSITKWIHLNFGDKGLKQAFRRMYLQLNPQGMLILEAQPFDNYGRRKKMTETIFKNFNEMKFLPKDFSEYLLSTEVGFSSVELMGVPDHCKKGFKRPIQIFFKK
ncbi:probable RNA methyltransferase CG1239 [Lucilia cuprina]|uniref:probable RNA methyltransferase CG1239 n=1 Tax=Lucilia cuprina TaxID=7375 RepID=UPI001F0619C7|nr:probable RNA methyltransferase CG1239 [Lucilia cuprina]